MMAADFASGERKRFPVVLVVVSAVLLPLLLALGTWQIHRLQWKQNLLATLQSRIDMAPRPYNLVAADFARTGDVEYIPIIVFGHFRHDGEAHFLATHKGQSGWYVYTPLVLESGLEILVNRGFVAYDRKNPETRPGGQSAGKQMVTGLARNPIVNKPSALVPDNDPIKNVFYWKDLQTMAKQGSPPEAGNLAPFFVDAGPGNRPPGAPIGGVTRVELPNNHLGYAITWFGLAAALSGVLGVFIWRWRNGA